MSTAKLLFPVAFTDACSAMAAYVQRAASLFDASVVLLHVVDPEELDLLEGFALYIRPGFELKAEHMARRTLQLSEYLTTQFPLASSERLVLTGAPSEVIARYASNHSIKVVVMPTHTGRFRQKLLGSTTARVIDSAPCPVLTGTHAQDQAPRPLSHRRWICALDRSQISNSLLLTAKHYADEACAQLSVIHVLDAREIEGHGEPLAINSLEERTLWLNELVGKCAPGATFEVIVGSTKQALEEALLADDADVLIVGRNPGQTGAGHMADLTYALVRDSPFPVLSV